MTIQLKPQQIQAAKHLSEGITVTDTAKELNISRWTIHSWLSGDDNFIAYLNLLKREILDSTTVQIQNATTIAVQTLLKVMKTSKSDSARIQAAKEILSMGGYTKETLELHGWNVGETDPMKVKAAKASKKLFDDLMNV